MNDAETIISALERAPALVIPLVTEVPESILKRRPTPSKWSAHEHACHLAAVHPLMIARLDLMLELQTPHIRSYLPHVDEPDGALLQVDLQEAMENFVRVRGDLVKRLRGLSAADWQRAAEHDEYARYSVFIMFRHLAVHDFFHAYRIEELLLKKDWDSC